MDPDKPHGPKGFNAYFFQPCWNIVKEDIVKAINNFFKKGKLLKQVNSTFIVIIPYPKLITL